VPSDPGLNVKNFLTKTLIFTLTLSLAGCSSNTTRENKAIGATVGAAAGAGLGAASGASPGPITVVATGAVIGALIGWSIGNSMENCDKEKAYAAIAAGKTATWQNPNSKIIYTVIPASSYVTFNCNPYCRHFTAMQTTDGNTRKIYRIACREAHGNWQLAHRISASHTICPAAQPDDHAH